MKKLLILFFAIISLVSCEQYVTRQFGGNSTIELKPGEKLVEVTWKGDADIWVLTEPMDSDYVPKTKTFQEYSMMGVLNGTVTFIETK